MLLFGRLRGPGGVRDALGEERRSLRNLHLSYHQDPTDELLQLATYMYEMQMDFKC